MISFLLSLFAFALYLLLFSAPMRTWVIGDSIVFQAGETDVQLPGGGFTLWKGTPGQKIAGFRNKINRFLRNNPFPTTVILHVGTCYILKDTTTNIRGRVEENLKVIRNLLPDTRIIWSDILPRQFYQNEATPKAGKKCTININKEAHKICRSLGNAHVIKTSRVFNPKNSALFKFDGLHLSPHGNECFRKLLGDALVYFNLNPGAISYPPSL